MVQQRGTEAVMAICRFCTIAVVVTAILSSVPMAAEVPGAFQRGIVGHPFPREAVAKPSPREVIAEPSPDGVHTFRLRYQSEGFRFPRYFDYGDLEVVFKKEPAFEGTNIVRGALTADPEQAAVFGFAWDKEGKTLYLDTDRDLDLTDETPWDQSADRDWCASFNGISLQIPVDGQPIDCRIDLDLYYASPSVNADVRSGWVGMVNLEGRDYEVAFPGDLAGELFTFDASMVFAPNAGGLGWGDITSRHPACLRATPELFLNGASYRLEVQFDGGDILVSFTEIDRPLRTVSFVGEHVSRLVLCEYGEHSVCFQAVLDNPSGTVSVPRGEYSYATVTLHEGSAPGLWRGTAIGGIVDGIEIRDDGPIELRYGAPLKNVVTTTCSTSEVILFQRVTGISGAWYSPSEESEEDAPTYAIRHAGKELVSGKFEYG
jgi:hypothetical protein